MKSGLRLPTGIPYISSVETYRTCPPTHTAQAQPRSTRLGLSALGLSLMLLLARCAHEADQRARMILRANFASRVKDSLLLKENLVAAPESQSGVQVGGRPGDPSLPIDIHSREKLDASKSLHSRSAWDAWRQRRQDASASMAMTRRLSFSSSRPLTGAPGVWRWNRHISSGPDIAFS